MTNYYDLAMIKGQLSPDLREALVRALPPGEQLVIETAVYQEQWKRHSLEYSSDVFDVFQGTSWFMLALTNVNLRVFNYKSVTTRKGFLLKESFLVPEIIDMKVIPLNSVTTSRCVVGLPKRQVLKHLQSTFSGVQEFAVISVNYGTENLECASPYVELKQLGEMLDAHISGTGLALQIQETSDALTQLSELLRDGLLTQREFDQAKSGLLVRETEFTESVPGIIRQMHILYKQGILTESEFNMKKWDLLSR